jgi:uncharacterized membrane protein YphA (DoxX/SURF4 family)
MSRSSPPTARCPATGRPIFTLIVGLMRIAIGWHFLYEGLIKLVDTKWSAAGYLQSSTGPAAMWFKDMAADQAVLSMVNQLNIWGLIVIGLCLMLGLASRLSALAGILLLGLYYLCQPPFFGPEQFGVAEGHYMIVNKNLVELLALCVVLFYPAGRLGLDGILFSRPLWPGRGKRDAAQSADGQPSAPSGRLTRRQLLAGMTGVPFVGGFAFAMVKKHRLISHEESQLVFKLRRDGATMADAISRPSKTFDWSRLDNIEGELPTAKIGKLTLSRMILGGNLIAGWAHARDLIYISELVKAYHKREKIFETFSLAEACGVNTVLANPILCDLINDYWRTLGGKIRFISDCGGDDVLEMIQKSIDNGACACYIQGSAADKLVAEENFDLIEEALELIRRNGIPAGIGAQKLVTVSTCVEKGFQPDFWMKTLHHHDYGSAKPEEKRDNIWCEQPKETAAFMKDVKQPWIAFKTLAAGAIEPEVGFKYAFENGADFICVDMFDFQIVDDVNIALKVLEGDLNRQREWRA